MRVEVKCAAPTALGQCRGNDTQALPGWADVWRSAPSTSSGRALRASKPRLLPGKTFPGRAGPLRFAQGRLSATLGMTRGRVVSSSSIRCWWREQQVPPLRCASVPRHAGTSGTTILTFGRARIPEKNCDPDKRVTSSERSRKPALSEVEGDLRYSQPSSNPNGSAPFPAVIPQPVIQQEKPT